MSRDKEREYLNILIEEHLHLTGRSLRVPDDVLDAILDEYVHKDELKNALESLKHADIFLKTRERMHPDGIRLHQQSIIQAKRVLGEEEL